MTDNVPAYGELFRPQLHFSAPRNWLNDPVGMVCFEGRYHLFYQYNPSDSVWGNMHWGHAVSTDLLHWQHRPVALHADPVGLGYVFSGSAAVDWTNSSGLGSAGRPPLVALFTHHSHGGHQVQSLAHSNDGGDSWHMHPGNPILANPGIADFRDPKLIPDERRGRWLMALAAHDRVQFYVSRNLLDWTFLSDFADGPQQGVWECPDLFPLALPGGGEKWVLLVSVNPGAPNGGSGTRYFIGDFDGERFTSDQREPLWLDHGPDNYAGVTWNDVPASDGRRLFIAWMNNWRYANLLPTAPWRGAMTLPRQLSLIETAHGLRLAAPPVEEIGALRRRWLPAVEAVDVADRLDLSAQEEVPPLAEIRLSVDDPDHRWSLRLHNARDEALSLTFDPSARLLHADRSLASSGLASASGFSDRITAPVEAPLGRPMQLRLLKDSSSLEVWTGEGAGLLALNYFTVHPLDRLDIANLCPERPLAVGSVRIAELESIWSLPS